jgi:general secretion pathway protein H
MKLFCPNHQGFTLLELIVVMVLIGITVSFTVPQIGGFLVADQMKTTTRRLIGLVHQTASLARSERRAYLLSYQAGEHRFVAEPEVEIEQTANQRDRKIIALPVASSVMVGGIWSWFGGRSDGEERKIRFSRDGYIEPTILYLGEANGREMSVILSPFLGTVRVVDQYVVPDPALFAQ